MTPLPHPLPLRSDAERLGLHRVGVPTSLGDVVVRAGDRTGAPATILLHGAAGTWTTWTPLLSAAAARGIPLHDVVAIDLPGWGDSGDGARVRTVEDMADAVVQVARALGHDRWRLVGHSLGGVIALDIAARHPSATLDVTIVSGSGAAVLDAIRRPVRGGLTLPGFAGMLATMRALAAGGAGARRLVRVLDGWGWMPLLTAPLFASAVHPSVVAAFADEIRPAAFARAARLAARYDEGCWTGIRCPVRSVRGMRDVFGGDDDDVRFDALIADFRETRVAGAGHFAHIERPDAVLYAIADAERSRPAVARAG